MLISFGGGIALSAERTEVQDVVKISPGERGPRAFARSPLKPSSRVSQSAALFYAWLQKPTRPEDVMRNALRGERLQSSSTKGLFVSDPSLAEHSSFNDRSGGPKTSLSDGTNHASCGPYLQSRIAPSPDEPRHRPHA